MAQLLRTLAFTEDTGSVHVQDITCPCGYVTHLVHIHTHRQILSLKHFIHIKLKNTFERIMTGSYAKVNNSRKLHFEL